MIKIDYYRIKTDRWHRTWQAEWEGCLKAPRAWTSRGITRKARRWVRDDLAGRMPTFIHQETT